MNSKLTIERVLEAWDLEITSARERLEARLRSDLVAGPDGTEVNPRNPGNGEWTLVGERQGERYAWPNELEVYERFWIYRAPDGRQFGVGMIRGDGVADYWVTFLLGAGGGSKRPVVVFNATDDSEETAQTAAIIRGKGGGKAMFSPEDPLPEDYADMRIETYRDRIAGRRGYSFDKAAVIAHRDDHVTMLRHARAQVDLRGLEPAAA